MSEHNIHDVLTKYGESIEGNVWRVQGNVVILHKALERIAARAGIFFDPPVVLRAESDEAVILVTGRLVGAAPPSEGAGPHTTAEMLSRMEWSIGEAKIGANYRVSGKQAAYPYAMAEKRGKDRVILKLIELHGYAYSEDEADDFKAGKPRLVDLQEADPEPDGGESDPDWAPIAVSSGTGENRKSAYQARKDGKWEHLVESLRACSTMDEFKVWYAENAVDIEKLPAGWVKHLQEESGLWRQLVEALRACPDIASLIYWSDMHAEELEQLPAGWVAELREEWKVRAREIRDKAEA
jgi:hypothetical protein